MYLFSCQKVIVLPGWHQRETPPANFIKSRLWTCAQRGFLSFHLVLVAEASPLTHCIFNGILHHSLNGTPAKLNCSVKTNESCVKTTWTIPVHQRGYFQIATGRNAAATAHTEAGASNVAAGKGSQLSGDPSNGCVPSPVHSVLHHASLVFADNFTLDSQLGSIFKYENTSDHCLCLKKA